MSTPDVEKVALTDRDERRMLGVILEWLNEAEVPDAQPLARKIAANLRPTIDAELARRLPPDPLTPCGNRVCTGCSTCLVAWSRKDRADLEAWQVEMVDHYLDRVEASSIPPATPDAERPTEGEVG